MTPFLFRRQFFLFACLVVLPMCHKVQLTEQPLDFGRFGMVTLYSASRQPSAVILFVSGLEGWNQNAIGIAEALSSLDALVVGIDASRYLQALEATEDECSYPGGDFAALSKFVQQKFNFPRYVLPVLVGYAAGATLAYATLAQAPPDMFKGVFSLNFCPELPLKKPLCEWNELHWNPDSPGQGFTFLPATALQAPWIVLQAAGEAKCSAATVATYVKQVELGKSRLLQPAGHGFSQPRDWLPQFKRAFAALVATPVVAHSPEQGTVQDLPLIEVPSSTSRGDTLAVILSGDGGWASIDRELGNTLAHLGIPVVGLNSLQYFWTPRTPESTAKDLERILQHYLTVWQKTKVLLVGYSRGADVLPFLVTRLSAVTLARIQEVALLGPAPRVDFEFHLADWLGESPSDTALPLLPEVQKLKGMKILCFYGTEEGDTLCKDLEPELATVIPLKGGHHFDGNYSAMAQIILGAAR